MDEQLDTMTEEPDGSPPYHGWPGLLSKEQARWYLGMSAGEFKELDDEGCIPFKRVVRPATSKLPARCSEKRYRKLDLDLWSQTFEGRTVADATKAYHVYLRDCQACVVPPQQPGQDPLSREEAE